MEKKINYRAQFTLKAKYNNPSNRFFLLKTISSWVTSNIQNEKFKEIIFKGFIDGHLDFKRENYHINVNSIPGKFNTSAPEYFAIRFSHEDTSKEMFGWRTWINDIGLEKLDEENYLFSLTNSYQMKSGFIGDVSEPFITSPNIIKTLVNSEYWTASVGETVVGLEPISVDHYNIKDVVSLIFNPKRVVPVIYISRDIENDFLVDPNSLSLKVAGNAIVYSESENSVGQSHFAIPKFNNYRCENGKIRIYLPNANPDNIMDFKRHRFFTIDQIHELTPIEVIKIIAESLVRRSVFTRPFRIQSINDIQSIGIEIKLREAIESKVDDAIINTYKEQVNALNAIIEEKNQELEQYCSLYDNADSDSQSFKNQNKLLEKKNYDLMIQIAELQKTSTAVPLESSVLEKIPTNLSDLLDMIADGYNEKIVILEEAKKSSRNFEVNDINKAWRLLRSIPDVLFPIIFESSGDKKAEYSGKTGFDIAMTESKKTKEDKKLAIQRSRIYNGVEININPHIGYGSRKPSMLRVHFYVSNEDKKIVIGHCGDHLDNFSTKNI